MAITKEHIRFFIHFAIHLKKNAAETTAMICAAYGENAVSHITCKRWYQKFRQRDFNLEGPQCSGHPQKIETVELQALLDITLRKLKRSLQNSLALRSKPFQYVYIRWERFKKKVDGFCIRNNSLLFLLI